MRRSRAFYEVAEENDRLAREHSIDAYYASSSLPVRLIESRRLAIIRSMIGEAAGLDLLEVGSGGGHVLRQFPNARRVALDVSAEYLTTAMKNLAGADVRFVHAELDGAGFAPASFDRVICTEVLEHTYDPERVLAGIARVLRPTGVACITVPNDPLITGLKAVARKTALSRLLGGQVDWGGDHYHRHHWTPREFHALLARRFRITQVKNAPFDGLPIRLCARCEPK